MGFMNSENFEKCEQAILEGVHEFEGRMTFASGSQPAINHSLVENIAKVKSQVMHMSMQQTMLRIVLNELIMCMDEDSQQKLLEAVQRSTQNTVEEMKKLAREQRAKDASRIVVPQQPLK